MDSTKSTLFAIALWLMPAAILQSARADEIAVTVGKQETVFPAGYRGLMCFSDEPISVLSTRPWTFTVVNGKTVLMRGATFETAVPVQEVLSPGPPNAFDSSYAGISGVYYCRNKREFVGIYHAEAVLSGYNSNSFNWLQQAPSGFGTGMVESA